MASYLDKIQINSAITDNTKLDLGHTHITTADFFQINVSDIQELVPGSKIDVNMESFARLNPLVVPTFGRASMRHRAFFVPFRTICRNFTDFITDAPHVGSSGYTPGQSASLISSVPYFNTEDLLDAFKNYATTSLSPADPNYMIYSVGNAATIYDIYWTSGLVSYWNYTVKGRQALKILESLGYKLDWGFSDKTVRLSALPLLAMAKIYLDYYYPISYSNRAEYDYLLSLCNYDVQGSVLHLTPADINSILQLISYCQYDSDAFTSAFDQPNSPNVGNYSTDFKLVNIDSVTDFYTNASTPSHITYNMQQGGVANRSAAASSTGDIIDRVGGMDAPFILPIIKGSTTSAGATTGTTTAISEYMLHSLHALTDYMKRHQLAGSRAMERYLARFGKALPAEKLNRSIYIGSHIQDIQIGDVMSTADTTSNATGEGTQLGAYAGRGLSYGNGNFNYSTDEFGYFIILTTIVPATGYYQGIDPLVMRVHKLDFWTPEFDSLGVEPIKAANLYIPTISPQMTSGNPYSQVFGFAPRYSSYKCSTYSDRLTGNYRLSSLNGGPFLNAGNSWHLMRTFDGVTDFSQDYANVVHSPGFISGGSDFGQYKRIFYDTDVDSPDNFTIIHNFEIAEYAPMKPLYDEYEFEDKGKKVTLEANGVKLN